MAFSTTEAMTGAGQGAAIGSEYGGGFGAAIGAASGFVLGGMLGGGIAAAQQRDLRYAQGMIAKGQEAISGMDPWATAGSNAYKTTADAMSPESLANNEELQYLTQDKMRRYGQQMRAKGKSLSGEFVRGAQDTYLNAFAEAQKAIMGPGIAVSQIGAGVAQGQMKAQEQLTGAALGITPLQTNYKPLVNMAGTFIADSLKSNSDAEGYDPTNYTMSGGGPGIDDNSYSGAYYDDWA